MIQTKVKICQIFLPDRELLCPYRLISVRFATRNEPYSFIFSIEDFTLGFEPLGRRNVSPKVTSERPLLPYDIVTYPFYTGGAEVISYIDMR